MRNKSNCFFLTMEPSPQNETVKVKARVNIAYISSTTHKPMKMNAGEWYELPAIEAMDDIRKGLVEQVFA